MALPKGGPGSGFSSLAKHWDTVVCLFYNFLTRAIFKISLEFVTTLYLFYVLVFRP